MFSRARKFFLDDGVHIWCALLLALVLVNWVDISTNPGSRLATMAAMSRDGTFQIDRYLNWTLDWAQPPNGHYYSEKGPGGFFVGYPFTWAWDRVAALVSPQAPLDMTERSRTYHFLLCLLTQVLPLCWVISRCVKALRVRGASYQAQNFAVIAAVFGNTAASCWNSYFGHGLGAVFLIAALLALLERRLVVFGFFFAWAVSVDYSGVFLVPVALAAIFFFDPATNWFKKSGFVVLGALVPLGLWCWYHAVCYGGPFTLPFQYVNPLFPRSEESTYAIWGVVAPIPRPEILMKLLFGEHRGILFTQPWVFGLVVLAIACFRKVDAQLRAWIVLGVVGLGSVLWMNASFNGWHGGGAPGPRYLAMIFPALGILSGFLFDRAGSKLRLFLWAGLGVALALRLLIYCASPYAPSEIPIWSYGWNELFHHTGPGNPWLALVFACLAAGFTARRCWLLRPSTK